MTADVRDGAEQRWLMIYSAERRRERERERERERRESSGEINYRSYVGLKEKRNVRQI